MMLNVEKVVFLKGVEIFAETRGAVLARLAEVIKELPVKKDASIITKGDFGDTLFIVVEGSFKVHDGKKVFATIGKHGVFGELSALVPEKRIASVTAAKDGILLSLDNETLNILMKENIEIAQGIITFLTMRLREELSAKNKTGK